MDEKKVREAIEDFKKLAELLQNKESVAVEHCNIAIEALEKQLPKKPVLKRNAYSGISVCPICGASDYGKYCRQCGQRIDREKEE